MFDTIWEILKDSWPTLVIFLAVISIIRIAYLKCNGKKFVFYKELFFLLFIAYILLLFQLVTYKEMESAGFNLVPFKEIFRYDPGSDGFYRQVIGNIILFIPFGYFVTYYVKIKKMRWIFFLTLLTSLIIETVQYFIGRCFDVDDIILNVAGGIIGFLLFIGLDAIKKHLPGLFQKDIIYSILSLLLIAFIILYLLGILNFG